MKQDELKVRECIWCGAEMRHENFGDDYDKGEEFYICPECGIYFDSENFDDIEEAIKNWNERPYIDRLLTHIAELEAERKRLPEVYDETKWKENLIRVRELFADRFGDVDVEQFFQKIRSESYPGSTKGE